MYIPASPLILAMRRMEWYEEVNVNCIWTASVALCGLDG